MESDATADQDARFEHAVAEFGSAIARLARGYEANSEHARDLVQEIHLALWQSLAGFDGRCSLRTWVYRVAHNVAIARVLRRRQRTRQLVGLDGLESTPDTIDLAAALDRRLALDRLFDLVRALTPVDRQVILLYLDGLEAADIGEITGLSPGNVATKVHRIKRVLAARFHQGGQR